MNYSNKIRKKLNTFSLFQLSVMLVAILFCCNYIQADDNLVATTNLATIILGDTKFYELIVENNSDKNLEVGVLKSSCDCLEIVDYPSKIDSGKSAVVKIKVEAVKVGAFAYLIELFGWDDKKPTFTLICEVDVIENSDTITSKKIDYINAELLIERLNQNENFIFIDVRLPKKFAAAHIRGAINMPLETIKARTFLKTKKIVIIDNGWGETLTETEIIKLKVRGFKSVYLLFGGIKAWRDYGGNFSGVGGDMAINEVAPRTLFMDQNSKKWTVIDLTLSTNICEKMFPKIIRFSTNKNNLDRLANEINAALAKMSNLNYIAIIDDDGRKARDLITKIIAPKNSVVFAAKGGLKALKERKIFNLAVTKSSAPGYISPRIKMKRTPCGGCL